VAFELVKKSEWIFEKKKQKWRRRSPETKNEAYRRMLSACTDNRLKFRYVLSDVFYSASQNMSHIKEELKREFIMALKTNPARWHSRLRTSEREHTTSELGL
jgi:hypothetical protein